MASWAAMGSPAELAAELDRVGYLAGDGLATAAFLALRMGRPLFCEGEPGTGKTSLAAALASALGVELIKLQCHEGIDATQALYDWDFPRQLLHLRALEAASGGALDSDLAEKSLYSRRFLLARPLLRALEDAPCVLLVDEVDRADDEFEAFLLEVLGDFVVTIPELGEVRASVPPLVVLTSNRTREVHDALKRRCLYHWLEHPSLPREVAILRRRLPGVGERLATQVASAVQRLRAAELLKPPGVAESIDWAAALMALDRTELDAESAAATLGAVLKYREDAERTIAAGLDALLAG
jgi:MoxR-like ATPase